MSFNSDQKEVANQRQMIRVQDSNLGWISRTWDYLLTLFSRPNISTNIAITHSLQYMKALPPTQETLNVSQDKKRSKVSSYSLVSLQGVEGVTPIPLPSNWYITTLGPYSSPRDLWPWPLMVTAGTKFSVILPLVSLICAVGEVAKGTVKWSVVTWSALDIPTATGTSLSHRVSTPVYPLQRHSGQW